MALSPVAVNFWLFDPLLQTTFLNHFDALHTSDAWKAAKAPAAPAQKKGPKKPVKESVLSADVHGLLDDALGTLKIDRGSDLAPDHPRRQMAWFPIFNPLVHFNDNKGIKGNVSSSSNSFQAQLLHYTATQIDADDLDATVAASKGFGDFERVTGKSLSHYVAAYTQSPHSSFSRFSKYLRKKHMGRGSSQELLFFLSHPLLREESREHFLEGKALPLLEVDILHAWAAANEVTLPAAVASSVVAEEGEITGVNINQARADGKRLTRQQIIDQAKALLPHVLDGIAALDIDNRHEHKNLPAIFHHLCALFALASLYRDASVMALADPIEPGMTLAMRRMSVQDVSRATDQKRLSKLFTHLRLFHRNGGFYPCDKAAGDAFIAQIEEDHRLIEEQHTLPSFKQQVITPLHIKELNELRDSASMFSDATVLFRTQQQKRPGEPHGLTRDALLANSWRVIEIVTNNEACRAYGARLLVERLLSDTFDIFLPATAEIEEKLREHASLAFSGLVTNQEAMEQESLPILGALNSALTTYVVNKENEADIQRKVMPAIEKAQHRLNERISLFEKITASGKIPVLIAREFADGDDFPLWLVGLGATPQKDAAIESMIRLAYEHRYILGQARFLASRIDQEGVHHHQAINDALASLQMDAKEGENTFRALDDVMAALDEARAEYTQWASELADAAAQYAREIDNLFQDAAVLAMPFGEEMEQALLAQEDANEVTQGASDLQSANEELTAALHDVTEELSQTQDIVAKVTAERDSLQEVADKATAQAKSLSHHLSNAERSQQFAPQEAVVTGALLEGIADFADSPTPSNALSIAAALFPTQLIILDSAYDSAMATTEGCGSKILRRLVLLGTEGLALMEKGRPLYELNDILPGELACQESETCMSAAKLRSQRVFKESLPDGEIKEWLMTAHNWINYSHRLYFDYDHERNAFVIGHVGRHLEIASA